MEISQEQSASSWQKTSFANLVRYIPSGQYFARVRVHGKLIRRSLKTKTLSVAKLRLSDLEREERQKTETQTAGAEGNMNFLGALSIYRDRLRGNQALKPRSKSYREERIISLLKSWPQLKKIDVRKINKSDCLAWATQYAKTASPSNFNNTVGTFRQILEIAVEMGARYDNPVRFVKRVRVHAKSLTLPTQVQFFQLVQEIEKVNKRFSQDANLVRFLAFGGFRKNEAANVTWQDCDFLKREILIRGDEKTGTKNSMVRRVPMISEMKQLLISLQNELEQKTSDRVMKVKECQVAIDSACKKLGLTRFTHHDLRHLFATRCIESGVDIPTVSRWLGHKDGGALAMKVYGHLRDQHSTDMAQKVSFSRAAPKSSVPETISDLKPSFANTVTSDCEAQP